jgi:hypothetical protein
VNHMQNVSPKMGNEEAGRDVAEGYKIGTHVIVPGIVNVEQTISSPEDPSRVGGNGRDGTGQREYPPAGKLPVRCCVEAAP